MIAIALLCADCREMLAKYAHIHLRHLGHKLLSLNLNIFLLLGQPSNVDSQSRNLVSAGSKLLFNKHLPVRKLLVEERKALANVLLPLKLVPKRLNEPQQLLL